MGEAKGPATVTERCALASGVGATDTGLSILAADPSPRVRRVVAARTDVPEDLLARLSDDPDRRVRQRLVDNPACPPLALLRLLDDPNRVIAFMAAQHPNADVEVHRAAYGRNDTWLRESLGQIHDRLDDELAERLRSDPAKDVRTQIATVARDPFVSELLARDPEVQVRAAVGKNAATPKPVLRQLATDPRKSVRASVLIQGELPADVLTDLSRDRSADVRWALAAMRLDRPDLLEYLSNDSDELVASQARQGLKMPPKMLQRG